MADAPEQDLRLARVTPRAFHDAYSVLGSLSISVGYSISIDAPGALCKPEAFLEHLAAEDCRIDDPLFVFMAHEIFDTILRDEPTVDELIGRMMMAKDDIDAVIVWLEEL